MTLRKFRVRDLDYRLIYMVCNKGGIYLGTLRNDWNKKKSDKIKKYMAEHDEKISKLKDSGIDEYEFVLDTINNKKAAFLRSESDAYYQYSVVTECEDGCECSDKVERENYRCNEHKIDFIGGVRDFNTKSLMLKESLNISEDDNKLVLDFTNSRMYNKEGNIYVNSVLRFRVLINLDNMGLKVFKRTGSGRIREVLNLNEFTKFIGKSNYDVRATGLDVLRKEKVDYIFSRTGFREYFGNKGNYSRIISLDEALHGFREGSVDGSRFVRDLLDYLLYFNNYSLIESILKSGHVSYAMYCIENKRPLKESFKDEFGMSKRLLKYLKVLFNRDDGRFRRIDVVSYYILFSKLELVGGFLSDELLTFLEIEVMGDSYNAYNNLSNWKSLIEDYGYSNRSLYDYLIRVDQYQGMDKAEGLRILIDYNRMSKDIGVDYDMTPNSLKRSHDLVMREYNFVINDRNRNDYKNIKEDLKIYEYENDKYKIIVPEDLEDIVTEGKVLNHCVGSYANMIIQRKTSILFLRRKSDLEAPFYTIEVKEGRVVQCRGKSNKVVSGTELNTFVNSYKESLI